MLTKQEIITKMANAAGITKANAGKAFETLEETMVEEFQAGNKVTLHGIGIFSVKVRKARMGRNPQTGESIQVPERRVLTFMPSKNIKDMLNNW